MTWETPPGFAELDQAAVVLAQLRISTATDAEGRQLLAAEDVLHHHAHVARSYEAKHGAPHTSD